MKTLKDLALATGWEYDRENEDVVICHYERSIRIEYATGVAGNRGLFYFHKRDEYLTLSYETALAIAKDLSDQNNFTGKLLPFDDVRKLARDIWENGGGVWQQNIGFVIGIEAKNGFSYVVSYEKKPMTDRDFETAVVEYTRIYDLKNPNF